MDISDEGAHRALAYVSAISRAGYTLSTDEFRAYVESDARARARDQLGALGALVGLQWKPVTVSNALPRDWLTTKSAPKSLDLLDELVAVKWLDAADDRVVTTKLGQAVLRSMDERAMEPEQPLVTVLDAGDPLAYPVLIGAIEKRGEAMLVDPYFKIESLLHIVNSTHVNRLLIGPKADTSGLAIALATVIPNDRLEVRVSEAIHDRVVIPKAGEVDLLGTSLSGVGKRLSVMTTVQMPAAESIRSAYEEVWESAKRLPEAESE